MVPKKVRCGIFSPVQLQITFKLVLRQKMTTMQLVKTLLLKRFVSVVGIFSFIAIVK
jgi:hypothetical protein